MRCVLSRAVAIAAVGSLVAAPAFAQEWREAEPASDSPNSSDPSDLSGEEVPAAEEPTSGDVLLSDLVELKDGSTFRGVITERVVGEHVTILLPGGRIHEIDWVDVEYAGPWKRPVGDTAPGEKSEPSPESEAARFEFRGMAEPTPESEGGGLSLYLHAGVTVSRASAVGAHGAFVSWDAVTHGFKQVCTAPCDASLPAGTYEFALSGPGHDRPTTVQNQVQLPVGRSRLEGRFESNSATRGWGWAVFGTGIVGGFALMVAAVEEQCEPTPSAAGAELTECRLTLDPAMTLDGLGAWLVGMVVGGSMILERDEAFVTVIPLGPMPTGSGSAGAGASQSAIESDASATSWEHLAASPGLTVVGRF